MFVTKVIFVTEIVSKIDIGLFDYGDNRAENQQSMFDFDDLTYDFR